MCVAGEDDAVGAHQRGGDPRERTVARDGEGTARSFDGEVGSRRKRPRLADVGSKRHRERAGLVGPSVEERQEPRAQREVARAHGERQGDDPMRRRARLHGAPRAGCRRPRGGAR